MSASVVAVEEKICGAVKQHAPAEENDGVRLAPVANTEDHQNKRHRVEDIKHVLPLREEIPF